MPAMDLNTGAFLLVALLLAVYAVLDGFDLGVGMLSLLARSEEERDLHVAAVGPIWDGNEVWLLAAGNVLFGAFPAAFATLFSAYYLPLVLVLLGLMARGVAIEFRLQHPSPRWRRAWSLAFGLGSVLPAVLLGVAAGGVLGGLPIGAGFSWQGDLLSLLRPSALLGGLASCAYFVLHGALFLRRKVDGEPAGRLGRIALGAWVGFTALLVAATAATLQVAPRLAGWPGGPVSWALDLLVLAALVTIPLATRSGRTGLAFAASSATGALLVLAAARAAYPVLLPSTLGSGLSITIYDGASTSGTIGTMLTIALIGLPILAGYTIAVYRVFAGPVRPAPH